MNKAKDLILELYKKDHITKEETSTLLDSIQPTCSNNYSNWGKADIADMAKKGGVRGVVNKILEPDWTYRPAEQPYWTITNTNTDK